MIAPALRWTLSRPCTVAIRELESGHHGQLRQQTDLGIRGKVRQRGDVKAKLPALAEFAEAASKRNQVISRDIDRSQH